MHEAKLQRALEAERKAHHRTAQLRSDAQERAERWHQRYLATARELRAEKAARERDVRRLVTQIGELQRRQQTLLNPDIGAGNKR